MHPLTQYQKSEILPSNKAMARSEAKRVRRCDAEEKEETLYPIARMADPDWLSRGARAATHAGSFGARATALNERSGVQPALLVLKSSAKRPMTGPAGRLPPRRARVRAARPKLRAWAASGRRAGPSGLRAGHRRRGWSTLPGPRSRRTAPARRWHSGCSANRACEWRGRAGPWW